MAMVGESPEESPEVPEPDLSMELQDQLKRCLTEHEACCEKEEVQVRRLQLQPDREQAQREEVRERYAEAAVIEMVTTLKSFDPEISKEKLSNDIYSILHSDAVVGHLNPQLKGALRKYVPRNRKEWLAEDIERHIAAKRAFLRVANQKLRRALDDVVRRLPVASAPFDRAAVTRVTLLSAGGSAVLLGAYGGALGFAGGTAAGSLVGTVPAPLTLGLSIPTGAAVGGGLGACTGVLAGATVGLVGGGAAGGVAYIYRADLQDGVVYVKTKASASSSTARTKALETTGYLKVSAIDAMDCARAHANCFARVAAEAVSDASTVAANAAEQVSLAVHDRAFQAGAVSAAGGAVAVGTGGGAVGLMTGGTIGAACGVVPALFTFGLSIPIGAAIGSGAGLCLGAAAGGATGFVGGGAAGYGAYSRRGEIRDGLTGARHRASDWAQLLKTKLAGDKGGTC